MGELTGSLIEMNAKMVMTGTATTMIWVGFMLAAAFVLFTVVAVAHDSWLALVFFCAALICVIVGVAGAKMGRIKEIRYCANGPISIEQVAATYDIIKIDGKEIVVRER